MTIGEIAGARGDRGEQRHGDGEATHPVGRSPRRVRELLFRRSRRQRGLFADLGGIQFSLAVSLADGLLGRDAFRLRRDRGLDERAVGFADRVVTRFEKRLCDRQRGRSASRLRCAHAACEARPI